MASADLKRLGPQHVRAISMMMTGCTNLEIGADLKVDHTTVSKWRHDPLVREEVARQSAQVLAEARGILTAAAVPAALTLKAAASLEDTTDICPTKRLAACAVLDRLGLTGPAVDSASADGAAMTPDEALATLELLPESVLEQVLERKRAKGGA